MRYAWDEAKRVANLRKHGLDFADRLAYGENRFLSVGVLRGLPVSIVHTETDNEIRIISFRKATKRETAFLIENL